MRHAGTRRQAAAAGRTGCDGSGRGPPIIAAVLLCWTLRAVRRPLAGRAREVAGCRRQRTLRRARHDARRLRHELALGLQRRRARRRLAGFFDAQANARRHEPRRCLARTALGRRSLGGAGGAAASATGGRGSARAPAPARRPVRALRPPARARRRRPALGARRRRARPAAALRPAPRRGRLVGGGVGRPGRLDQARRRQRRRSRLGRLGRGARPSCRRGLDLRRSSPPATACSEKMSPFGSFDTALPREAFDELPRDDLFERARRALQLDAVDLLEQLQHFLAGGVQQFSDLVNPDCGQAFSSCLDYFDSSAGAASTIAWSAVSRLAARRRGLTVGRGVSRPRRWRLRAHRAAPRLPCASLLRS